MAKLVRSAKGQMVDFELLKMKEALSTNPTTVEVKSRERFIENKMKRKLKKAQNKMLEDQKATAVKVEATEEPVVEVVEETPEKTKRKINKVQNET